MSDAALISAVFVGVMFGFYLMFLRPVQKDQERHKKDIRDLRPGDEVLTTSGFIGRVRDIQVQEKGPTRLSLELADGVVVTAITSAIAQRIGAREEPAKVSETNSDPASMPS
jgi:preprotein translocase subunit YajC